MTQPLPETPEIDISHLEQMFETWPHAVFALDRSCRYVYQNELDRTAFGDIIGKLAQDLMDKTAYKEDWAAYHSRVLAGQTITQHMTDGDAENGRDAELMMSPLRKGGKVIGILGMAIDRSEAAKLQRQTQATSARLERLTNNVPGGIFEFRIKANGEASFDYVSSGMGPMLGATNDELLNDAEAGFRHDHPDDAAYLNDAIAASLETLEPVKITHRVLHPSLGLRWHRVNASPSRDADGSTVWHGCIFDVTEEWTRADELERARNRMEALTLVDPLTGLPNRRACDDHMARRVKDEVVRRRSCTVLRIDLDHFKAVNDTLGHDAGDAVLCHVADMLQEITRDGDFAARLGGDEFVIVLAPGCDKSDGKKVIAQLRDMIAEPFEFEGRHCRFDASFGIAESDIHPRDRTELLSSADAALLHAKRQGRGRTAVFTKTLQGEIIQHRRRMSQIRDALEREEFYPVFQPQIDARSGKVSGFEVLARWRRPEEGNIPPIDFIPVAEQMRVVQDIDRMMFDKALLALGRLQDAGHLIPKVSFNVSTARINDPGIISSVKQLQTNGTRVAFELLESILLEDETTIFTHHIDRLKELGIEIEVDDFGSGHASVIGVLKVSPTALKIDRRLIQPMFDSKASMGLLRAIIDIGLSLDIAVTAEGVETMNHAWALRDMGCNTLQGFEFGKPMSEHDLKLYLDRFEPVFDGQETSIRSFQ